MTIEAAIVFPIIMLSTCVLLMFGMVMYMKVLTVHAAASAAERTTVVWNNSHKSPASGEFPEHQYDDLYWRTLEDKMLDRLFDGIGESDHYELSLPELRGEAADHLAESKLYSGGSFVTSPLQGKLSYENQMIERMVKAEIGHPSRSTMLENMTGARVEVEGEAVGIITEPAEFIRTVELVRFMSVRLQGMSKLGATPTAAGAIIEKSKQP